MGVGFALAGVKSHIVEDKAEASEVLKKCVNDDNIDILLISEHLAHEVRVEMVEYEQRDRPIIIEIPGRVRLEKEDPIKDIVKKAIGIDIER